MPQSMFRNRVTEALGIRYPIIQGGMQWVGRCGTSLSRVECRRSRNPYRFDPTQPLTLLAREIRALQGADGQTLQVSISPFCPQFPRHPMPNTVDAASSAAAFRASSKTRGPTVQRDIWPSSNRRALRSFTNARPCAHALSAEQRMASTSCPSMDSSALKATPARMTFPAWCWIPLAAKALKLPIIVCGGIGDGRGMAAALSLGAEGVTMGTRFVCTQEAPVHHDLKIALCKASERDTNLMFRTLNNTVRVFKNAISDEVVAMERRAGGCVFDDVRHLVSGARGRQAWEEGDVNGGALTAGMVIGLIDDISDLWRTGGNGSLRNASAIYTAHSAGQRPEKMGYLNQSMSRHHLPAITLENAFFWRAGADGLLEIYPLPGLRALCHHPPLPICPSCQSRNVADGRPSREEGRGAVVYDQSTGVGAWSGGALCNSDCGNG